MGNYRLDKTAFRKMTFEQADSANIFGKDVPYAERLRQAYFLISQAYGFSMSNQPRLDKKIHSSRKLDN